MLNGSTNSEYNIKMLFFVINKSLNTLLGLLYVVVCVMQQFSHHRFDVLTNIAGLGQGRTVTDCKRHVQTVCQRLRQQSLTYKKSENLRVDRQAHHFNVLSVWNEYWNI